MRYRLYYFFYFLFLLEIAWPNPFQDFFLNENKSGIERAGDVIAIALPVSGLSSTYVLKNKNDKTKFWKSYLSSLSLTYLLKYSINKERPNGSCCESFPSGHTTSAFSGAMFIQKKYGYKYGIPCLALASFVGYSRVYADMHYWEDVFVGATIGMLGSIIFSGDRVNWSLFKNNNNLNLSVNLNL